MAIISGLSPKIYIDDGSEVHSIRFKDYSLGQDNILSSYSNSKLTATPNRVTSSFVSGEGVVSFELETYFHHIDTGSYITAAEKLLWESLTATPSQEFLSSYIVDFSSSNSNKLKELTIYIEYDNLTIKINNAVVESASISLDLNSIASVKWRLTALSIDTDGVSAPGSYDDLYNDNFYRNKLNVLLLTQLGTSYKLPIIDGEIVIENTVQYVQRAVLGTYNKPQEHYVKDRLVSGSIKAYLKTDTDYSLDLYNNIKSISNKNTKYYLTIYINGCEQTEMIKFEMPRIVLQLPTIDITSKPATLSFKYTANETLLGSNDDLIITYYKYDLPSIIDAEVQDSIETII